MRALSGFYSFVHFLLSEGDSKSAAGKKKKCVCMCVHVHVDMSVRWDEVEKVSFQPQHLHISSLIFHLASKSILNFCLDSDLL